jgi:hypothetical protein
MARFAPDAVSWPLWLRVVLTFPLAAITYVLGRSLYVAARDGDPRAAFMFFLLGIFLLYAVPFARSLWRPSTSWRYEQLRADAAGHRIAEQARCRADSSEMGKAFGSTSRPTRRRRPKDGMGPAPRAMSPLTCMYANPIGCGRGDSNPHARRHGDLNAAWLPLHHSRLPSIVGRPAPLMAAQQVNPRASRVCTPPDGSPAKRGQLRVDASCGRVCRPALHAGSLARGFRPLSQVGGIKALVVARHNG